MALEKQLLEKLEVKDASLFIPGVRNLSAKLNVEDGLEAVAVPVVQNQTIPTFIIENSYDELVKTDVQNTLHCLDRLETERMGICHDHDADAARRWNLVSLSQTEALLWIFGV